PRRCAHQVYSIFAPSSEATIRAILFSKPSSRSLLNGILFGSAATRSTGAVGSSAALTTHSDKAHAIRSPTRSRKAEHIKRASLGGVLGQLSDGVDEAEGGAAVTNIKIPRDHRPRPTAYARQ